MAIPKPSRDHNENHYLGDGALQRVGYHWGEVTHVNRSAEAYMSMYRTSDCPTRCFVDYTPGYLRDSAALLNLQAFMTTDQMSRARFLVVLREPIARDLSRWNQLASKFPTNVRRGEDYIEGYNDTGLGAYTQRSADLIARWSSCAGPKWAPSVELYTRCAETDNKLGYGMYYAQLQMWYRVFPPDRFSVWLMESVLSDPTLFLRNVSTFLGMPRLHALPANGKVQMPHENEEPFPGKITSIACSTRELFASVYRLWNQALFHLEPQLGHAFTEAVKCH